ncbi:MAG: molybdopterin-dependent oxidoreductase [Anaerolineaceae bacterium]|jgi:DMSO/TMAO reductase YedYZ molybdopterin-dependent catalytic subunit
MIDGSKSRGEVEMLMRQEGRMPPGQAATLKFPVLHYGSVPPFDPRTWDFRVWGEVEAPIRLTWDEFSCLLHTRVKMDIHCVTGWSKFDVEWEGVLVSTLLKQGLIKLLPTAQFVLQHAEQGFTANLPLDAMLQDNFLMATTYNGQPLEPEHGFPLRGVIGAIPGRNELKTPYFWKGAKWLRGLEFMKADRLGFWEQAGYNNSADVWKEERYR